MPIPPGIVELFGWRTHGAPNIADKDSPSSVAISALLFERLGVDRVSAEPGQTLGTRFEQEVAGFVASELSGSPRDFDVGRKVITDFVQYQHLDRISTLLKEVDPDGTLRSEMGTDYLIKPDVTVGLPGGPVASFLHAAISCKWTIRSDRVQNIRHEGVILGRHRRGRQPHVVTVTCEPLPSRLAAIARGTGEVDCVYHAGLDELVAAMRDANDSGSVDLSSELDVLSELTEQDRLRPLDALPEVLAYF